MPNCWCSTCAAGARPLVVQLPLLTTKCWAGSYSVWFTPITTVRSSFLAGAEIMTRFAPPLVICTAAFSRSVKKPVASITTSTPASFHAMFAGSRSLNTVMRCPSTCSAPSAASTGTGSVPSRESYFSRWARVLLSVRSLMATIWRSGLPSAARRTLRPIRPKPLIPTLTMMHSLSVLSGVTLGVRSDGVNDKKGSDYAILRQWKRWRYSPGVR